MINKPTVLDDGHEDRNAKEKTTGATRNKMTKKIEYQEAAVNDIGKRWQRNEQCLSLANMRDFGAYSGLASSSIDMCIADRRS